MFGLEVRLEVIVSDIRGVYWVFDWLVSYKFLYNNHNLRLDQNPVIKMARAAGLW